MNATTADRADLAPAATCAASTRGARAFTLVELLIVIAILIVLVSILLPALSQARKLTRKTVCASNIRHLALSNRMYAARNEGSFVRAAADIWGPNLKRWHGERDTINEAFDPTRSAMIDQMGSAGLKECPSFRGEVDFSDEPGQEAGFEAGCGGYGYNASYVGGRTDLYGVSGDAAAHSARLEDVAKPSQTVMFTDAAYVSVIEGSTRKIAYSFCEPPFWQFSPGEPSTMRPDPSIDFRHSSRANVAWVDTHVTSRMLDFSVSYETHSRISGREAKRRGIGWFGPESNALFDLQ